MATVVGRKERFDDLKLSARVFMGNKTAVVGLVIFLLFVGDAIVIETVPGLVGVQYPNLIFPPGFTLTHPECVNQDPLPPSLEHPFGTTMYGGTTGIGCIDLLQLIMKAIPFDLAISFLIVGVGALLGSLLGVLSGYAGGLIDEALMRITDIFFTIPFLVLAIAVGYMLQRTLIIFALAFVIVWWPLYARYARSLTLSTKESTFVEAARASGTRSPIIVLRHIMPNVIPSILVQISLDVGTVMALYATLGFIGLLPSSTSQPELGYITNFGLALAPLGYWWTVIAPGAVITIFALAMNLMGDGLRDVIDPRRRS